MNKKYIILLLIVLLGIFIPKTAFAASTIKYPVINANPVFVDSDDDKTIISQAWINITDRKEMKSTDKFEANKAYQYSVQYTGDRSFLKTPIDNKYPCSSSSYDYEGTIIKQLGFYMDDACIFPAEELVHLDIDNPVIGNYPPLAKPNSHYTIIDNYWYNLTDNKKMTGTDVFERSKKYKYTVKYKTLYEAHDFLGNFFVQDFGNVLKRLNQGSMGIVNTDSITIYTGSLDELLITEGAVIIDNSNQPTAGKTLTGVNVRTNDSIKETTNEWVKVVNNEEIPYNNTEIKEGETYKLKVSITKEDFYNLDENFRVINNNKNYNYVSESTTMRNNIIYYEATYLIKRHVSSIILTPDKEEPYAVGDIININAEVLPSDAVDKTLTWESRDTSVATVDQNGKVTVLKPGSTFIYATAVNGVEAVFTLNVYTELESIELSMTSLDIDVDDYRMLSVIFHPNEVADKQITWISSNPDIASVASDGTVTGLKVGETTITARAGNGMSATCLVRVNEKAPTILPKYNVTFYDEDGETILKDAVEYEEGTSSLEIVLPDNLDKESKVLIGWYTDKDFQEEYDFNSSIMSDIDLYGKWENISLLLTSSLDLVDYNEVFVNYDYNIERKLTIKNEGNIPLKLSLNSPHEIGPFGSLGFNSEKILEPNEEYQITLVALANSPFASEVGDYNGNYTITGTSLDESRNYDLVLPTKIKIKKLPMNVAYKTHVQSYGWQDYVRNGVMSGTSGEAKRLEGIKIKLENQYYQGNILYRTHIQSYGWETVFRKNDEMSGTSGQAKRLEAIEIKLDGELSNYYDVYYRVHAQTFGWLGWAKNGEAAGTASFAKRLEGIEIKLVPKEEDFIEYGQKEAFKDKSVVYKTHIQSYGWETDYAYDGIMSGTSGEAKRLEGIVIQLNNQKYPGDIEYRTHIQGIGWESTFKKNGAVSGTFGQAKRLEAIQIRLTGEMADNFDIYYRVHAQSFGWLAWAKNNEEAGTAGFAKRLEGIEIVLVKKNESPPIRTNQNNNKAFINY